MPCICLSLKGPVRDGKICLSDMPLCKRTYVCLKAHICLFNCYAKLLKPGVWVILEFYFCNNFLCSWQKNVIINPFLSLSWKSLNLFNGQAHWECTLTVHVVFHFKNLRNTKKRKNWRRFYTKSYSDVSIIYNICIFYSDLKIPINCKLLTTA